MTSSFSGSSLIQNTAPYPFAEVDKLVAALKERGITPLDFGVGDPTSPTPALAIQVAAAAMQEHKTTGYPSYAGMPTFRAAAGRYLRRRFGVDLNPETEITSTIGSKEAVFHLPLALINPGDVVLIPTPGYPPMTTGTRYAGGVPYFVPLLESNNFLIDYEAIPADILQRAKVLWLNYPNSPTGAIASLDYYKGLYAWARRHNIILASDEGCYIDLYFDETPPPSLLEVGREGVIAFYSLSKRNNMTGWRVGFAAGDATLISHFKKVKTNIDSGTPNFIQAGAAAMLDDDSHVALMREEYRHKRALLLPALEAAGLPKIKAGATFFLWQKAPAGMDGIALAKALLADNIAIVCVPGGWISTPDSQHQQNPGMAYVRFALVAPQASVEEAVSRLHGQRLARAA